MERGRKRKIPARYRPELLQTDYETSDSDYDLLPKSSYSPAQLLEHDSSDSQQHEQQEQQENCTSHAHLQRSHQLQGQDEPQTAGIYHDEVFNVNEELESEEDDNVANISIIQPELHVNPESIPSLSDNTNSDSIPGVVDDSSDDNVNSQEHNFAVTEENLQDYIDSESESDIPKSFKEVLDHFKNEFLSIEINHHVSKTATNAFWMLTFKHIKELCHAMECDNDKIPQFGHIRNQLYDAKVPKVDMQIGYINKTTGQLSIVDAEKTPVSKFPPKDFSKVYEIAQVKV